MVFYGASGHGKVVVDAWLSSGGRVTSIVDDNTNLRNLLGHQVAGKYSPEKVGGAPVVISIGDNSIRKRIAGNLTCSFGKVVHAASVVSPLASIDVGTVVMAGAIVNAESKIGKHVIVNTAAVVEHDCRVGDYVHISPNATLCGGVTVGEGTHIGAGATVIPNIKIGKWAVIGAGSVVIEDIPDFALVVGVPGKVKSVRAEL